jgi:hypothetical protein
MIVINIIITHHLGHSGSTLTHKLLLLLLVNDDDTEHDCSSDMIVIVVGDSHRHPSVTILNHHICWHITPRFRFVPLPHSMFHDLEMHRKIFQILKSPSPECLIVFGIRFFSFLIFIPIPILARIMWWYIHTAFVEEKISPVLVHLMDITSVDDYRIEAITVSL